MDGLPPLRKGEGVALFINIWSFWKSFAVELEYRSQKKWGIVVMLYEKQEFTMKNGKTAVMRSPRREDAEAMLLYISRMTEETVFV